MKTPCMCGGCSACGYDETVGEEYGRCSECGGTVVRYKFRNHTEYVCNTCRDGTVDIEPLDVDYGEDC